MHAIQSNVILLISLAHLGGQTLLATHRESHKDIANVASACHFVWTLKHLASYVQGTSV